MKAEIENKDTEVVFKPFTLKLDVSSENDLKYLLSLFYQDITAVSELDTGSRKLGFNPERVDEMKAWNALINKLPRED